MILLEWQKLLLDIGHIRSAIGLAHLLVNQRFKQFSGLIKNCEDNVTPKGNEIDVEVTRSNGYFVSVTPMDLQGFWEMIYYQVEDIYTKFKYLDGLDLWSRTISIRLSSSPTETKYNERFRILSRRRGLMLKSTKKCQKYYLFPNMINTQLIIGQLTRIGPQIKSRC